MLDEAEELREGIELLKRFLPDVSRFIFGIEKNKPECIAKIKETFASDKMVSVKALPLRYPQGAEKVLIHTTTKLIVPEGKLPADVGVLVFNVTTLAAIAKYIKTGMPLVERCVTVDGSAIRQPMNVIIPIGTSVRDLVEFTGGLDEAPVKIIFGGPMTGFAAHSFDEPVVKTTNAVLVFSEEDAILKPATACIHCGKCVESCPHMLEPTSFCKALDIDNQDERLARLEELRINLCVECGCCSYVCPANRPLVESNRSAKKFVREYKAHKANLK
jgi:electron transport complex protein RnfC